MDTKSAVDFSDAVHLIGVMPLIKAELRKQEDAVLNRAVTELGVGEMTPDKAFQALVEVAAARRVAQRLDQRVAMGQAQAKNVMKGAEKGLKNA